MRTFQITGYKYIRQKKYSLITFASNREHAQQIFHQIFDAKIFNKVREVKFKENDDAQYRKTLKMTPEKIYKYEIQIQADAWQQVWTEFPETRRLLYAVPNGGRRLIVDAMQLKASGLVPGIPDLVFHWYKKTYGLECKIPGGRLSPEQIKVHDAWKGHVEEVIVWYSVAELIAIVRRIIGK